MHQPHQRDGIRSTGFEAEEEFPEPVTVPPVKSFDEFDAALEAIPVATETAPPARESIDIDALLADFD